MLPSELVRACGFGSEATVTVQDKKLVVTASKSEPREGWAEAMEAISQEQLDKDYAELQSFRETSMLGMGRSGNLEFRTSAPIWRARPRAVTCCHDSFKPTARARNAEAF